MEYILKKYKILISLLLLFVFVASGTIIIVRYFKPFIAMIIIYLLSIPIYNCIIKFRINKKISSVLSILIINTILILTIIYLGSSIINIFCEIYSDNYDIINDLFTYFKTLLNCEGNIVGKIFSSIGNESIRTGAISTGEGIISYFIGNVCTFFLLTDKYEILKNIYVIFPSNFFRQALLKKSVLKQMIKIEILLVVLSMCECILVFKLFGINKYIQFGILCGILDILPCVGTIIVFIPIIIYNIIGKQYFIAIGLTCAFILIQVIREFLEAKYLSDKLKLHPLIVLLSMYMGIKLFGMIGIIVGPMYSILAKEFIDNNVSDDV